MLPAVIKNGHNYNDLMKQICTLNTEFSDFVVFHGSNWYGIFMLNSGRFIGGTYYGDVSLEILLERHIRQEFITVVPVSPERAIQYQHLKRLKKEMYGYICEFNGLDYKTRLHVYTRILYPSYLEFSLDFEFRGTHLGRSGVQRGIPG